MNANQLHETIHQLEAGLAQLRQQERDAEDELARRRDARLRQEGALMAFQQMMRVLEQQAQAAQAAVAQEG